MRVWVFSLKVDSPWFKTTYYKVLVREKQAIMQLLQILVKLDNYTVVKLLVFLHEQFE